MQVESEKPFHATWRKEDWLQFYTGWIHRENFLCTACVSPDLTEYRILVICLVTRIEISWLCSCPPSVSSPHFAWYPALTIIFKCLRRKFLCFEGFRWKLLDAALCSWVLSAESLPNSQLPSLSLFSRTQTFFFLFSSFFFFFFLLSQSKRVYFQCSHL